MSTPGAGPRHQTTLTVLMTPDMANFSGNVHGGAILKLLDQVCLERIARYKRPKHYRFVDTLPTNNYGKVVKRELRDRLRQEPLDDQH